MAAVNVALKPFRTPNFVLPEDETKSSFALSQVSEEALESMCEDFRVEVLRKAGYQVERRTA